jgi:Protein of unknown function (DUF1580)
MSRSDPNSGPLVSPAEHETAPLFEERLLYLAEVPRHLASTLQGRRVHLSTVMRWRTRGVRGARLEAFRLGGRWVTSREALARFIAAVTAASRSTTPRDLIPTRIPSSITGALDAEGL